MPNSVITVNSSTTSIPILLQLNTCDTDDSSSNIYFDYLYIMFNLGGIKLVRLFLKKFLEMLLFAAAVYSIFKYFTFTNPNAHTVTTIVVVSTSFLLIYMLFLSGKCLL